MKKTRILVVNDASILGTGYGVYLNELLKRLQLTNKYEIAELACYIDINNPRLKDYKWKVYPNVPSTNDQDYKNYAKNQLNAFGSWRFNHVALHFKPDIVFDIRDYWMYAYQEASPYRKFYKWVVMPTVDSAPQKNEWLQTFCNMDLVIPYTEWAKSTLTKQCGKSINLFPDIANAGVDLKTFVPAENIKQHKEKIFGKDLSITGAVMRNQKRKLFPDLFIAYRKYLDRLITEGKTELYNKSYLYLHTSYPEPNGWDIPQLLIENRLVDKVYFTSFCKNCGAVYPTKFHESISICNNCNKNDLRMPSSGYSVPTSSLVKIYQCFDLFIQLAICEGFGMPQVEAAACGVPIASVDYSAMSEIVRKLKGYTIPVKRLFREMETGADRAYPDIESVVNIIYEYHVNTIEKEKENKRLQTRTMCEKYYSWEDVADVWDRAFDTLDLTTNIPWDSELRPIYNSKTVPKGLSKKQFVEYIVREIIDEPDLMYTAAIQMILRDYSNGYARINGQLVNMTTEIVVKNLEEFMNSKKTHEAVRLNPEKLFTQDYLNV